MSLDMVNRHRGRQGEGRVLSYRGNALLFVLALAVLMACAAVIALDLMRPDGAPAGPWRAAGTASKAPPPKTASKAPVPAAPAPKTALPNAAAPKTPPPKTPPPKTPPPKAAAPKAAAPRMEPIACPPEWKARGATCWRAL